MAELTADARFRARLHAAYSGRRPVITRSYLSVMTRVYCKRRTGLVLLFRVYKRSMLAIARVFGALCEIYTIHFKLVAPSVRYLYNIPHVCGALFEIFTTFSKGDCRTTIYFPDLTFLH